MADNNQKPETSFKVLVKRKIFLKAMSKVAGTHKTAIAGDIVTITKSEYKQYGGAVTRDLPDDYEE